VQIMKSSTTDGVSIIAISNILIHSPNVIYNTQGSTMKADEMSSMARKYSDFE
jgi:hypothetical protein